MRRFYAAPENFTGETVVLSQDETKHLRDVLRLRAGDEATVFDGAGNEFLCRVGTVERGDKFVRLTILRKISSPALESNLQLVLAAALLKGEKFDFVVQKAVELGVTSIVPLNTKRADVQFDRKSAAKRLERWQRIALEAAKQSGRAFVPQIETPRTLIDVLRQSQSRIFFFTERGGAPLASNQIEPPQKVIAAVGSEGGWEDEEIELARENNAQLVTLGGRILRAETAAVTVVALLQHIYGDLR